MRRFFLICLCCLLLTTAVHATGTITGMQSNAVIAKDGTCEISMVMQVTVEQVKEDLRFPLPKEAKDISLNGRGAGTEREDSLRWVDLSHVIYGAGSYTLSLHYSLPDLIVAEEEKLMLVLPLLSGFDYPIDRLDFTVTLPGEPEVMPTFSSTYHPESMDTQMKVSVDGSVITGYCRQGLKDHESLQMRLEVTDDLFPQPIIKKWSLSGDDMARYGLTLLALLFWLISLRCKLPRAVRRVQAPSGITAGELGCCLTGRGVDFSMMVLSWAQMGYLTIQMDRHQRVRLHKTMDMGNERSEFEMRIFKTMFGKRSTVDATTERFARLSMKAARTIPGAWNYFKKSTGNPLVFRCLTAGIGLFAGISFGTAFATDTAWQIILSILLGMLGALGAWWIQAGTRCLPIRHKYDLWIALGSSLAFVMMGNFAGELNVAVYVIVSQLLAGLLSAHGGRRTESGIQSRNEILGLRRYLKTITAEELGRITLNNPEYYFAMAPYAMALGVDSGFARQFGGEVLPVCPYLTVEGRQDLTAKQWNDRLRQVVKVLDDRQYKKTVQRLLKR